ncbi:hypothetical protein BOTNAR_1564g00040 [Botryotinia narcissicola]|uniref:Uncharacterized protein n=1 Tax=Botryotinia narcissicola TaxID=278944 RepID=A0A4Z1H566_9HELO|nr:hypothetical protein BOTNAR_1564g00040 [Botryotinia narcissicola]
MQYTYAGPNLAMPSKMHQMVVQRSRWSQLQEEAAPRHHVNIKNRTEEMKYAKRKTMTKTTGTALSLTMVISSRSRAGLSDSTSDNLQTTTIRSIKNNHAFNSRQRTFLILQEKSIKMQFQLTTILSVLALMSGSVKVLAAPTPD